MKTRHLEPGAERIAFMELSESILEGVAGGYSETKDKKVNAARLTKKQRAVLAELTELGEFAELVELVERAGNEPVFHICADK
jgi:hypothetical protein